MANQEGKTTTTTETTTVEREITIVSTRGEKTKIKFSGKTWDELKKKVEDAGFSTSSMKCVESIGKTTLEHPKAVVPEGNFNLFLMPYKSKSGSDRTDVYNIIKGFMSENEEKARNHFNAGKNYTQKSTTELQELVDSYKPGTRKVISAEKGKAIADVVGNVKAAKGNIANIAEQLEGLSLSQKLDVCIAILLSAKGSSANTDNEETATVKSGADLQKEKEEEEERTKKEKEDKEKKEKEAEEKRKKKEEDDKLDAEMRDLAGDFNDVRL